MAGDITKHCPVCGAQPGEPCVWSETRNTSRLERPSLHFYRWNDEPVPVLVGDEPDYA